MIFIKIKDILKNKDNILSFEIFPPKKTSSIETIFNVIEPLSNLNPDFISVTYGAGGSTSKNTLDISQIIQNKYNIPSVAHFSCYGIKKSQLYDELENFKEKNINNILALRGDKPAEGLDKKEDYFSYANELISEIKKTDYFSIGAACYPEGHFECDNKEKDIIYLKKKVDAGCDYLITQLFFENNYFYDFMDNAQKNNIDIPILAGIMPITNLKSISKICDLCNVQIPKALKLNLEKYSDSSSDIQKVGMEYALNQMYDLRKNGFTKFHLYTMNKYEIANYITKNFI